MNPLQIYTYNVIYNWSYSVLLFSEFYLAIPFFVNLSFLFLRISFILLSAVQVMFWSLFFALLIDQKTTLFVLWIFDTWWCKVTKYFYLIKLLFFGNVFLGEEYFLTSFFISSVVSGFSIKYRYLSTFFRKEIAFVYPLKQCFSNYGPRPILATEGLYLGREAFNRNREETLHFQFFF